MIRGLGIVDPKIFDSPQIQSYDYLTGGPGQQALFDIAAATVQRLLTGAGGPVTVGGVSTVIGSHQEIAAVFAGRTDTAYLIAYSLVSTLISKEKQNRVPINRTPFYSLAVKLPHQIEELLANAGNPAECQFNFEQSFGDFQKLNGSMQVPSFISPTGWCERVPFLTDRCKVGSFCALQTDKNGVAYALPMPAPTADTRPVVATTTGAPAPPPSHADVEHSIDVKMGGSGQSYEHVAALADKSQFKMYLNTMTQARTFLIRALALAKNATDDEIWEALSALGISPPEAIDWFLGCNANLDCFRTEMNVALGEAEERQRDDHAKLVTVITVAVGAVFAYLALRGGH